MAKKHVVYENQIELFFQSVAKVLNVRYTLVCNYSMVNLQGDKQCVDFVESLYNNWKSLYLNSDAVLPDVVWQPKMFDGAKNYRAYYACQAVYHAMVRYYRYYAKYGVKNDELEVALKEWYVVSKPKQNIFVRMFSGFKRQK